MIKFMALIFCFISLSINAKCIEVDSGSEFKIQENVKNMLNTNFEKIMDPADFLLRVRLKIRSVTSKSSLRPEELSILRKIDFYNPSESGVKSKTQDCLRSISAGLYLSDRVSPEIHKAVKNFILRDDLRFGMMPIKVSIMEWKFPIEATPVIAKQSLSHFFVSEDYLGFIDWMLTEKEETVSSIIIVIGSIFAIGLLILASYVCSKVLAKSIQADKKNILEAMNINKNKTESEDRLQYQDPDGDPALRKLIEKFETIMTNSIESGIDIYIRVLFFKNERISKLLIAFLFKNLDVVNVSKLRMATPERFLKKIGEGVNTEIERSDTDDITKSLFTLISRSLVAPKEDKVQNIEKQKSLIITDKFFKKLIDVNGGYFSFFQSELPLYIFSRYLELLSSSKLNSILLNKNKVNLADFYMQVDVLEQEKQLISEIGSIYNSLSYHDEYLFLKNLYALKGEKAVQVMTASFFPVFLFFDFRANDLKQFILSLDTTERGLFFYTLGEKRYAKALSSLEGSERMVSAIEFDVSKLRKDKLSEAEFKDLSIRFTKDIRDFIDCEEYEVCKKVHLKRILNAFRPNELKENRKKIKSVVKNVERSSNKVSRKNKEKIDENLFQLPVVKPFSFAK